MSTLVIHERNGCYVYICFIDEASCQLELVTTSSYLNYAYQVHA